MEDLVKCYRSGDGVPRDPAEADAWSKKAAAAKKNAAE
jgi:TPR repeat protein